MPADRTWTPTQANRWIAGVGRERSIEGFHSVIGIASLLVAGASDIRLGVIGNIPSTSGIAAQVVVLDCVASPFTHPHRRVAFLIDAVAAQSLTRFSSAPL